MFFRSNIDKSRTSQSVRIPEDQGDLVEDFLEEIDDSSFLSRQWHRPRRPMSSWTIISRLALFNLNIETLCLLLKI